MRREKKSNQQSGETPQGKGLAADKGPIASKNRVTSSRQLPDL